MLLQTNRIALLCDVNTATTDTDDASLLQVITNGTSDIHFYENPDGGGTPYTNVGGFTGQFNRGFCQFRIKQNTSLRSSRVKIQVQLSDGQTFDLETWNNTTEAFYNGLFSDVNIFQFRDFFLPDDSLYNIRSITRNSSLDSGGYYGYELNYGFQLGFQWFQILNDYAKQYETYRSQYWPVYTQNKVVNGAPIQVDGGTASIKFIIEWDILDIATDVVTQFSQTANIICRDYILNNTAVITTKDAVFGDDLSQNIADDVETTITATFSGTNITVVPSGVLVAEFWVYYQDGTINRFDSVNNFSSILEGSKWISTPNITIIDNDNATVEATLNMGSKLMASVGVIILPGHVTGVGLLTDSGIQIQTDSGVDIYID